MQLGVMSLREKWGYRTEMCSESRGQDPLTDPTKMNLTDLMMVMAQAQKLKGQLTLIDQMASMMHHGIFKLAAGGISGRKIQNILVLLSVNHLGVITMVHLVQGMLQKLLSPRWRAMALLLHVMAL
uniref:Uncharacterized protein n=1 Tax=Arundo donax TaxID=35708 RepID=A0A0A9F956_ARUDO